MTQTRRNFLKTAPVAAVAIAVPLAGAADAAFAKTNPLAELIARCEAVTANFLALDERMGVLLNTTGKPDYPLVAFTEIPARNRMIGWNLTHLDREEIVEYFETVKRRQALNAPYNSAEILNRWAREIREDLQITLALFDERKALYDAWRERSGVRALVEDMEAVSDEEIRLENAILEYAPQSMEDVRLKAKFFLDTYDPECGNELSRTLIESMIKVA